MAKYIVTIPNWHPKTLNALMHMHWGKAARLKRISRDTVFYYFCLLPKKALPRARRRRRVTLTIVLGKGQRGADPDAYWKDCLDSLTACNMLVDDNRQGVVLMPVQFERAATPATRIELEDVP